MMKSKGSYVKLGKSSLRATHRDYTLDTVAKEKALYLSDMVPEEVMLEHGRDEFLQDARENPRTS
eukprot:CAMPEP_0113551352 /NCGR_PEP_ID=MMETSP0015_2-20120614/14477_1 /TAXON_ID=2838 /ORGANISM="Odontella" /LENGTH=64 /DNA_ID=CAMNT_0000452235 /DNA_START=287 /DNA_END=481 /DNA_ORIENTATION=- /assembly_acc=CAM_ASM_000160